MIAARAEGAANGYIYKFVACGSMEELAYWYTMGSWESMIEGVFRVLSIRMSLNTSCSFFASWCFMQSVLTSSSVSRKHQH